MSLSPTTCFHRILAASLLASCIEYTPSKFTQEEADKPDAGFFNGEKNDDCTYDEFDRSGGKLTLRMTCDTDEGGSAKIAMDGKFGRDSFTMTMSNVVSGSENGDVTMKGTISGKRIGDCAG